MIDFNKSWKYPFFILIAGPVSELYGVKCWFLISGSVIVIMIIAMLVKENNCHLKDKYVR